MYIRGSVQSYWKKNLKEELHNVKKREKTEKRSQKNYNNNFTGRKRKEVMQVFDELDAILGVNLLRNHHLTLVQKLAMDYQVIYLMMINACHSHQYLSLYKLVVVIKKKRKIGLIF